jgi:nitrate reductase NapE
MNGIDQKQPATVFTKGQELRSFLFLSVVMAPVLAVAIVGGYGFLVWMVQMVAGPPGS